MVTYEAVAQTKAGLSVNYEDINDEFVKRFFISQSARALATTLVVTHETWIGWLQALGQLL